MRARVQKWGNPLAAGLPESVAGEVGVGPDSSVDLIVIDGKIVVTPVRDFFTLDDLPEGMSEENFHDDVDCGSTVGKEVW